MAGSGAKIVVSAILGNGFITTIKFIGWFFSQSPSLLAEAIHSVADTSNQILLLIGMKQSQKHVSREHPHGQGEARYLWNLISAVGIFFLGFGVTAFHGLHALLSGHYEVGGVSWVAIGVLIIALLIEGYVLIQAYREVESMREEKGYLHFLKDCDDPTIIAILLEDGVAVLGVLLALTGIILGQVFQSALFDIGASLLICLLLGLMAVLLAFINGKLLIGKSVNFHDEKEIYNFIQSLGEVKSIEALSTQILGAGQVRLSLEVVFDAHLLMDLESLERDAKLIEKGEQAIKVLAKASERMVRLTGQKINHLESLIQKKYPEIVYIDLEVY